MNPDHCASCNALLDVERRVYPSPRGLICPTCQVMREIQAESHQLSLLASVTEPKERR